MSATIIKRGREPHGCDLPDVESVPEFSHARCDECGAYWVSYSYGWDAAGPFFYLGLLLRWLWRSAVGWTYRRD